MKGKYLSPKADLTFKLVFAEHPDWAMSLLNALLPLADDAPITKYESLDQLEYVDLRKVMDFVDKSAMTEEQLYAYERFGDAVNRENVLAEGKYAEGKAEGRDERSLEIARNLKGMNLPTADIAKATGLTAEEIEAL